MITLLVAALLCAPALFAQTDADYVSNWQMPIYSWFTPSIPSVGVDAYPRAQAEAYKVENFSAQAADFDAVWSSVMGDGFKIASQLGYTPSHKGADDFKDAAFKVLYDDYNMYVLVQYTDDDVTGNESVELMWAPYFKLDGSKNPNPDSYAWTQRFAAFGAYKATFKKVGFDAAMMLTFDNIGAGTINWGGTNALLNGSLSITNKTAVGSSTVKQIIRIGYDALTGEARPVFDVDTWKALNDGKGISFDIKVNDFDTNDEMNGAIKDPAAYWWNATNNDGYQSTIYSGFLLPNLGNGVKNILYNTSVFRIVTSDMVELTDVFNVKVFDSRGKEVMKLTSNKVDLKPLGKGVYVISANNQIRKIVK